MIVKLEVNVTDDQQTDPEIPAYAEKFVLDVTDRLLRRMSHYFQLAKDTMALSSELSYLAFDTNDGVFLDKEGEEHGVSGIVLLVHPDWCSWEASYEGPGYEGILSTSMVMRDRLEKMMQDMDKGRKSASGIERR